MVLHVEEYEHGHIYISDNGCSKSDYCATTDDKTQYGKLMTSIDGADECAKYLFFKAWNSEKPLIQEYILTMIPELQQRISNGNVQNLSVNHLLKVANQRLYKMGYTKTCPRCGGTGNYSFNQMYGTTCFKCGGKKIVLQTVTKKLIAQIKKSR